MPKYCKAKAEAFSDNYMIAVGYEKVCDMMIAFLGMDPGSDSVISTNYFGLKTFAVTPCGFQVLILLATLIVAFILGVYVRSVINIALVL